MGDANMMNNGMWAGNLLWMLVIAIVVIIPAWRICKRIGYPGWLGILIVVPLANLVLLYFIAFSNWPVNKNVNQQN
ncbi:MAG: hypothetical protein CML17_11085 [Pusillimonas sp.]|jgi:hypothetical protein|nr:hypothetical protein [Pusillimonas sp.]|tara:strand:- start:84 stop:311 length:228 start_codon:yes stop_codon:yes gene_type:complete